MEGTKQLRTDAEEVELVAFLSNKQDEFGDRCGGITLEFKLIANLGVWYDDYQETLTLPTTEKGIANSKCFILCASEGYAESWFCVRDNHGTHSKQAHRDSR